MAKGKDVHVSGNRSDGYKVTQGGTVIGRAQTQQQAIQNIGRPAAVRTEAELFIHRTDNGQIRARDSHGHDPESSKG
ncbi:MAG: DUF2188 domain-containing protein [Armatimonadetes bacterium]|nr:DUF2188 domain-containing protein [Armatimonadota bacterium]